jgi:hypothetical protein
MVGRRNARSILVLGASTSHPDRPALPGGERVPRGAGRPGPGRPTHTRPSVGASPRAARRPRGSRRLPGRSGARRHATRRATPPASPTSADSLGPNGHRHRRHPQLARLDRSALPTVDLLARVSSQGGPQRGAGRNLVQARSIAVAMGPPRRPSFRRTRSCHGAGVVRRRACEEGTRSPSVYPSALQRGIAHPSQEKDHARVLILEDKQEWLMTVSSVAPPGHPPGQARAACSTLFPSCRGSTTVHAQAREAGTGNPADTIAPTHGLPRDSRSRVAGAGEHRGAVFFVQRQGDDLRGLQPGLRLYGA